MWLEILEFWKSERCYKDKAKQSPCGVSALRTLPVYLSTYEGHLALMDIYRIGLT